MFEKNSCRETDKLQIFDFWVWEEGPGRITCSVNTWFINIYNVNVYLLQSSADIIFCSAPLLQLQVWGSFGETETANPYNTSVTYVRIQYIIHFSVWQRNKLFFHLKETFLTLVIYMSAGTYTHTTHQQIFVVYYNIYI